MCKAIENEAFRALYDNGVICVWHKPQIWRNVFTHFKLVGSAEGHGVLFCNDVPIRETGGLKR